MISMAAGGYNEQTNPNKLNEEIYGDDVMQNNAEVSIEQSDKRYAVLVKQFEQQQKYMQQLQKQLKCLQEENASLKNL